MRCKLGVSAILLYLIFQPIIPLPAIEQGPSTQERLTVPGLKEPVEILKDAWGISHIYAKNQPDLFFAQGFNVARDRLFQLEVWRRQATGTWAEVLGSRAVERDIGSRLFQARVDMSAELAHYHPDGEEIIGSFVKGINAYIGLTQDNPDLLPLEFRLLGFEPGHWTPEVVVSRHNGLFRNATTEISMARAVAEFGEDRLRELVDFHPGNPSLALPEGLDISLLTREILRIYRASRSSVDFTGEDLLSAQWGPFSTQDQPDMGSNNWVVGGQRTLSGAPILANDPHRSQQIPSLRYWIHLNAPGWDVIGGGEPALPGVSIGHNRHGAWGLTIFSVDQEDLFVYETDPENPRRYRYGEGWEEMSIVRETIPVKGADPVDAELKYTRHGPVVYEDSANRKAYALRAAWLEVGCAPYLASLRMDQARSWEEFREACSFSRTPSENMIWADRAGNIGWQAVGITPLREGWEGLIPVPGDGRFEWNGYLPIKSLPSILNPPEHVFSSANEDNIPPGYPHVLGFLWTAPFRQARIQEVLGSGRKFTMTDMMRLQHDVLSIPARTLVPLLDGLKSENQDVEAALSRLRAWDFRMSPDSIAAAIYQTWQRRISREVWRLTVSEDEMPLLPRRSFSKIMGWLTAPDGRFGTDPVLGRDQVLLRTLEEALDDLAERLGPDPSGWRYGQENYHHIHIRHPLSDIVPPELRSRLDVGPRPRGGSGDTVNQTGSGFNQTSGASFRILADLSDWDNSMGTNSPGQSGDPASLHYRDLFELWVQDKYFPAFFSKERIKSVTETVTTLVPGRTAVR